MGWLLKWKEGREEMKIWDLHVTSIYLVLLAFIFKNLEESHNEMACSSSWTLLRQWDETTGCWRRMSSAEQAYVEFQNKLISDVYKVKLKNPHVIHTMHGFVWNNLL